MRTIILASASPRRRELLEQIGLQVSVMTADTDESIDFSQGDVREWTMQLAKRKAQAVLEKYQLKDSLILSADTMVCCEGEILHKPVSLEDAAAKLRILSGRSHEVVTGFCLLDQMQKKEYLQAVTTKVYFRDLEEAEIQAYAASGEGADKAGGYGIQGLGAVLVEKIEGCYFNVVGLPLSAVYQRLRELGAEGFRANV